eukprot:GHRR01004359.1.p1 GENE.GHRR01004359.1~~GHRR01004359.1.p1  ORF type:complete len:324 (+),score=101.32 GHRR01004359.1:1477-2448(+)
MNMAATSSAVVLLDSPYQPTSRSHVSELANTILSRGSSLDNGNQQQSHSGQPLPDSPFQPQSRSHVAALIQAVKGRASSDVDSRLTKKQSAPSDSGLDVPVGSFVKAFEKLAAGGNGSLHRSHGSGFLSASSVVTTPTVTAAMPAGPFTPHEPANRYSKNVGSDQVGKGSTASAPVNQDSDGQMQMPEIIHLQHGNSKSRSSGSFSNVSRLAHKFAAEDNTAELAAITTHDPMTVAAQRSVQPDARSQPIRIASLPAVSATPNSSADGALQRALSPRHKCQVRAARAASTALAECKANLDQLALSPVPFEAETPCRGELLHRA